MNTPLLPLFALTLACHSPTGEANDPSTPPAPEWIELFNGQDLEGWTPKIRGQALGEDAAHTFRVVDGLLRVAYDEYGNFSDRFGHLFFAGEFSEYRLLVEYRFVGEQLPDGPGWAWRNSGVMVHGQAPETMAREQEFPVSIEVQLLGGRESGERPTANLCTPGTHVVMDAGLEKKHCISSSSDTFRGDAWVAVEIVVRGGERIEHWIDGQRVLSYTQPQLDPDDPEAAPLIGAAGPLLTRGSISLQSESHPVEFRRVALRPL